MADDDKGFLSVEERQAMLYQLSKKDLAGHIDGIAITGKSDENGQDAYNKIAKWDGAGNSLAERDKALAERFANSYQDEHKTPLKADDLQGLKAATANVKSEWDKEQGLLAAANHFESSVVGRADHSSQIPTMSAQEKKVLIEQFQADHNYIALREGKPQLAMDGNINDKQTQAVLNGVNEQYLAENPQFKQKPVQDASVQPPPAPAPKATPKHTEAAVSVAAQTRAEAELHAMNLDQNNAAYLASKGLTAEDGKFGGNSNKDAAAAGLKGANLAETVAKIDAEFKRRGGNAETVVETANADLAKPVGAKPDGIQNAGNQPAASGQGTGEPTATPVSAVDSKAVMARISKDIQSGNSQDMLSAVAQLKQAMGGNLKDTRAEQDLQTGNGKDLLAEVAEKLHKAVGGNAQQADASSASLQVPKAAPIIRQAPSAGPNI